MSIDLIIGLWVSQKKTKTEFGPYFIKLSKVFKSVHFSSLYPEALLTWKQFSVYLALGKNISMCMYIWNGTLNCTAEQWETGNKRILGYAVDPISQTGHVGGNQSNSF